MLLKIAPEMSAASITPIPAAVLRIRTDSMNDNVPTTMATNQTNPKSISKYFQRLRSLTSEVFNPVSVTLNPVRIGAPHPLYPNTKPEMRYDRIPVIAIINETAKHRVMYLLNSTFHLF